jgi:tRNA threonylcarbamoyladenosine biosynthesis protein TsaE
MNHLELNSNSPEETAALADRIARACSGGELILLDGPMGAGKTCFASGFAAGLGIAEPAVSPTFVIMRAYDSPRALTLYHFDFYRLLGPGDLDSVGFEDCLRPDAIVLVEWPSRCAEALESPTLHIRIEPVSDTARSIRITGEADLLERIQN